jgi:hypothetical protein
MEKLIMQVAVAYMLKVLKSDKIIDFQKNEFAAIRHGNYDQFLELVNGPIPEMVVYNSGKIKTSNISQKEDFDFAALIKAGPSLLVFYESCRKHYGKIDDLDIDDETFEKVALFEIGLRMHANNKRLLVANDNLETVIDKMSSALKMTHEEISKLHLGRQFLNMIKHKKRKFDSWDIGLNAFQSALVVIDYYRLKVI